ncbi:uncharacterized protein LOC134716808 [Mytilus trossulus]|uniref:uncharacterized protein LOC134716808 n=1 Tax=Mytilus trossulus TaxID=6551 RepID=UPI0030062184
MKAISICAVATCFACLNSNPITKTDFGVTVDVVAHDVTILLNYLNLTFQKESKHLTVKLQSREKQLNCTFSNKNDDDKIKWIFCAYNAIYDILQSIRDKYGLSFETAEIITAHITKILCDFKLYIMQLQNTDDDIVKSLPGCPSRKCKEKELKMREMMQSLRDAITIVGSIKKSVRQVFEVDEMKEDILKSTVQNVIQTTVHSITQVSTNSVMSTTDKGILENVTDASLKDANVTAENNVSNRKAHRSKRMRKNKKKRKNRKCRNRKGKDEVRKCKRRNRNRRKNRKGNKLNRKHSRRNRRRKNLKNRKKNKNSSSRKDKRRNKTKH